MAELVILLENKADIVEALKIKIKLRDVGIELSGVVMPEGQLLPPVFIEDILKLEVAGIIS